MTSKPKFYIHCGTSKTGTTALQAALRNSKTALADAGFFYPLSGTIDHGEQDVRDVTAFAHRNIAWQLMRSRHYNPQHGDIAALALEIEASQQDVIISCEDFESLLDKPELFRPLFDVASNTGRDIVLVVYLRSQLAYFESLYGELLKHGTGEDYPRLADKVLAEGSLSARDCTYHFDYHRLLMPWRKVDGVTVIVRNFHDLCGGSTIADFGQLLDHEISLTSFPGAETANGRESLARSLTLYYRNRINRELTHQETVRVQFLGSNRTRLYSSGSLHARFRDRFQAGNLLVCNDWGLEPVGLDMNDHISRNGQVSLDQFFSYETHLAIILGSEPERSDPLIDAQSTSWMNGIGNVHQHITPMARLTFQRRKVQRYARWYAQRISRLALQRSV